MISSLKNRTRISLVVLVAFIAVFVLSAAAFASVKIEKSGPSPEFTAYQKQLKTGKKVPNYGYVPSPLDWSHLKNVSYTLSGVTGKNLKKAPAQYDIRDLTPAIWDQDPFGTCWTFSSAASTCSNLIKNGFATTAIDTSRWYQAYYAYNDESLNLTAFDIRNPLVPYYHDDNIGGNDWIATALFARGTGSVLTADAPYPISQAAAYKPTVTQRKYKLTDALYLGADGVLQPQIEASRRELIKDAVMSHGAVSIAFGWDSAGYNATTSAFFFNGTLGNSNHAVTIVGWDDSYPVSKFRADRQPSKPGAWIVRNSWGAGWGDKGYLYISYEEGSLKAGVAYITKPEPANEKIYQYDPLGCANWVWPTSTPNQSAAANMFTVEGDNEALSSVAFYTMTPNIDCTIKIYTNEQNKPTTGTLAATKTVSIAAPGYHTVVLDSAVPLTKGTKFSVVLEQKSSIGMRAGIPCENAVAGYSSKATAKAGEGWLDLGAGDGYEDITTYGGGYVNYSFCIKAFTTPPAAVVKVTSVTFDATSRTLNVGDNFTIKATVLPDNATNKALNWTTDNAAVATVSNGVVTAKTAGTAKITATAADGSGISATCDVTVITPAPAVVKVTSVTFDATSKTLNVDDTFTIKATVLPDNATNKALNWTTDNAAIATVSNGVVTAKAAGTAKITATAADGSGKLATCDVTVAGSPAPAPSGGGGGCNAGFAALALLALVPVIVRRKK